ncbi:melatonin receptor type 1A-like [Diadema setosum]|uniref:melatonin receptor type 1A-like n=1 Tax=Diadema setosum TaxID=31175 RepID=UPI003B3A7FEA
MIRCVGASTDVVVTTNSIINDDGFDGGNGTSIYNETASTLAPSISELGRGVFSWHPIAWSWVNVIKLSCAVLGVFGNLLVALIVFQRRGSNRSTDTLIGALAFADALTSICLLPIPIARVVPNNPLGWLYCKVIDGSMVFWLAMTSSTYTLVAISCDRFLAITFPIRFNRLVTNARVNCVVVLAWLIGVLVVGAGFDLVTLDGAARTCIYRSRSPAARHTYAWFVITARLILPATLLLLTQLLIARVLYLQSKRFSSLEESHASTVSSHLIARTRVIKMMVIVIVVYVVCWGPNQFFFFGLNTGFVPFSYLDTPLHTCLTVLAFGNSCANPFIYTAQNPKFRTALVEMFRGGKRVHTPIFTHIPVSTNKDDTQLSVIAT